MILPQGFCIEEGQEPSVLRYQNTNEIVSLLHEIIMAPEKYHSLMGNAHVFSSKYTLQAMQSLLKKILE